MDIYPVNKLIQESPVTDYISVTGDFYFSAGRKQIILLFIDW